MWADLDVRIAEGCGPPAFDAVILILPSKPLLVCATISGNWAGSVTSTPRVITINRRPPDANQR